MRKDTKYNLSVKVEWSVHTDWLKWMNEDYLPTIKTLEYFDDVKLYKLHDVDVTDGVMYVVQHSVKSTLHYKKYLKAEGNNFNKTMQLKWGNAILKFESLMQEL